MSILSTTIVVVLSSSVLVPLGFAQDGEAAPVAMAGDPALMACTGFIADLAIDRSVAGGGWKTRLRQPPMFDFDEGTDYFWKLSTNKGEITIKLWPDVAPNHVSSTMFLSEVGFYDGISFHRVIPGFMAQGGCPLGSGTGGPGYKYAGEFKPGVSHDRPYLLSMANAGSGTDGSQFFLTFAPTQFLDSKHTLFGEIVNGVETMKALEKAGTGSGKTREPLVIGKTTIEVKPKVVAALDKAVIPVSPTKQDKEAAPVVMADDPALLACTGFIADQVIDKSVPGGGWKTRLRQPPMFDFDEGTDYFWKLSTNKGEITVKLWPDVAPNHVSSTMFLSEVGFYDGISFHRVIPGFMAQGGCPLGSGTGGPGYKYAGEFKPGVSHDRPYLLSMANAGSGTDGSQFFLTFVPTQYLDNKHTLFGEIVNGVETMKALEKAGTGSGRPRETLVIEKASIEVRSKGAG